MIEVGDSGTLVQKDIMYGLGALVQNVARYSDGDEITFELEDGSVFVTMERDILSELDEQALRENERLCYVEWDHGLNNTRSTVSTLPRSQRKRTRSPSRSTRRRRRRRVAQGGSTRKRKDNKSAQR
jgi:hypothetical protein